MLGPLFSAVDVACEHHNEMLVAAKIRVCSVVYTGAADCMIVAIALPRRLVLEERLLACKRNSGGIVRKLAGFQAAREATFLPEYAIRPRENESLLEQM